MAFSFNKIREFSREVGGMLNVYGGKAEITLPVGYRIVDSNPYNAGKGPLSALPPIGNVLPAGTPFLADDFNHVAYIHYAFRVNAPVAASATSVQVTKGFEGTRAKPGMMVMFLPKDFDGDILDVQTGAGRRIVSVDSSNMEYDTITLSAAVGALAQDDILMSVVDDGQGTGSETTFDAQIIIPNATSYADIPVLGDETYQYIDGVHVCNVIYARRIAPIHPLLREYMNTHGYFVRFYEGQ